ncbi:hypothetical protein [Mycolicibacterium vinylchloridicum]|uniref:hypothetical protein n=1 Tax=Mycolicibacterium vinylchloridicum TaxID=2736928 RepID=UPI0015C82A9D|nr:hypothetical protein [Mycolicibacterium vinylchloridicum]
MTTVQRRDDSTQRAIPLPPAVVWKRLAPLIAAPGRRRMRLWNPATDKFSDTAQRTDRLPARPAALYLYTRNRTQLLWLDFDAKRYGRAAVETDMAAAAQWITDCGGVVVADRSTSGGGHLMCPLAIGTTASRDEMAALVRLLAARLPTLDITPNTNAETGCMTPPGSPCREGGYRQLCGTLDAAIEAFTTRSQPDLLPRLYMLLGALKETRHTNPAPERTVETYTEGHDDHRRLAVPYTRTDPLPAVVANYAAHGTLDSARPTWQSNHEARMSVVTQAVARGHSVASLRTMIAADGPWHNGLGKAYLRYHHRADEALARDVTKAFTWLATNVLKSSPPRHKRKYSPGGQQGPRGVHELRAWLANATAWADREFAGKRYRWTVHAVFQGLAFHAAVAGEHRAGSWLVGVGGRALSLATGLLSEDTVWRVLADVRERPGAPLLLVRRHVGLEADVYALTRQNVVSTNAHAVERCRIEAVHEAWAVLGHRLRRIYELVTHHGMTRKRDVYAAAAVPRATGDVMVQDLLVAGLISVTGHGTVGPGAESLDAVAQRHQLGEIRSARLQKHHAERVSWRRWLREREQLRSSGSQTCDHDVAASVMSGERPALIDDYDAWLESVMATGPPTDLYSIERDAIDMIADLLGGRIIAV